MNGHEMVVAAGYYDTSNVECVYAPFVYCQSVSNLPHANTSECQHSLVLCQHSLVLYWAIESRG